VTLRRRSVWHVVGDRCRILVDHRRSAGRAHRAQLSSLKPEAASRATHKPHGRVIHLQPSSTDHRPGRIDQRAQCVHSALREKSTALIAGSLDIERLERLGRNEH
jgi:hypothetical protein